MSKFLLIGSTSGFASSVFKKICTDENNIIYLIARSKEKNDAMLEELKDSIKAKVSFSQWDCNDVNACAEALKPFDLSDLDYCLYAPGVSIGVSLRQLKHDLLEKLYNINYFSFVEFIHKFLALKSRKYPTHIIACSSASTFCKEHSLSEYIGTKLLLENFAKCRQKDLAKFNVRVNLIAPALVKTPMIDNYLAVAFPEKEDIIKLQPLDIISADFIADEILHLFKDPYAASDVRCYSAGISCVL